MQTFTNHRTNTDFLDIRAALLRLDNETLTKVYCAIADQSSEAFDNYQSAREHYGRDDAVTDHYRTRWSDLADMSNELMNALAARNATV